MTDTWKKWLTGLSFGAISIGIGASIYAHQIKKQSLSSIVIESFLFNMKMDQKQDYLLEEKRYEKSLKTVIKANRKKALNPSALMMTRVKELVLDEMQVFIWNDQGRSDQKTIFYLHGGGYVSPPTEYHYLFLNSQARETGAKIVIPLYPRAPEFTFNDGFQKVLTAYEETLARLDSGQQMTLMGDSAGGGFALGFAMYLRDLGLEQPRNLVLISPWLDLSNSDEELYSLIDLDPFMTLNSLEFAGQAWAGSLENQRHPYVSPFFGTFDNLPLISIFTGTHEAFYSTIRTFSNKLQAQGIRHQLFVKDKMTHVYPLHPSPEGREARRQISSIINRRI